MSDLAIDDHFVKQDIKVEPITEQQLEELYAHTKSYEALFNKRARLISENSIDLKSLSDADYKSLLLEHYTFLKRPVTILDNQIFVGNSKATVNELRLALNEK